MPNQSTHKKLQQLKQLKKLSFEQFKKDFLKSELCCSTTIKPQRLKQIYLHG
jgi:hypothetical protein